MKVKILLLTSLFISFFVILFTIIEHLDDKPKIHENVVGENIEIMPLVNGDLYAHLASGGTPLAQRDSKFNKWLSVSVKINAGNSSGSGTIIYYDEKTNYAYVQSCGHLWNGNLLSDEAKKLNRTCKIIVWYHNNKKLDKPLEYSAEILYYINTKGKDCSLVRFKTNWVPFYIPIAPLDFVFTKDMRLNSLGCDSGTEVALYDVRYLGHFEKDIVTTENSPRPGRSGGGLLSNDLFVGVCWGTTELDGSGKGLFTPLDIVRELNEDMGYAWLNYAGTNWARQLPIIDRNNPQKKHPIDYIPIPGRRM